MMHSKKIEDFCKPFRGTIRDWAAMKSTDDILVYFWKDESRYGDCGYFTQFIFLPNNDVLVGITPYDEEKECRMEGTIEFIPLSKITRILVHKSKQS